MKLDNTVRVPACYAPFRALGNGEGGKVSQEYLQDNKEMAMMHCLGQAVDQRVDSSNQHQAAEQQSRGNASVDMLLRRTVFILA